MHATPCHWPRSNGHTRENRMPQSSDCSDRHRSRFDHIRSMTVTVEGTLVAMRTVSPRGWRLAPMLASWSSRSAITTAVSSAGLTRDLSRRLDDHRGPPVSSKVTTWARWGTHVLEDSVRDSGYVRYVPPTPFASGNLQYVQDTLSPHGSLRVSATGTSYHRYYWYSTRTIDSLHN